MTFTPLFLSERNASVIGTPCDSQDLFIPRSIIHSIVTVVLFWMVWLLVFQHYGQLYADDEIYMGVLLYVCAGQLAAQSPVPRPVGRQGSSWRHSHHSSPWHWISAQLWPTRVPLSRWLMAITGGTGRLLGFISADHSCSEAGTHFPVLGCLQHDSLNDSVDEKVPALGSQGWLHPCISHSSSSSNKHSAGRPTPAPHWVCKNSGGRQSWSHPYLGQCLL